MREQSKIAGSDHLAVIRSRVRETDTIGESEVQRYFLFFGLLFMALLMHVMLCEWGSGSRYHLNSLITPILVHEGRGGLIPGGTGLYTGEQINKANAIVYGIVAPLMLLGIDFYLLLGWRQQNSEHRFGF